MKTARPDMTIMSYPITYEARVMRPRHSTASMEPFGEWIDVLVEDVAEADAPIAMSWSRTDGDNRSTARMPEDQPYIARYHDESHWVPIILSKSTGSEHATVENLMPARISDAGMTSTPFRLEPRSIMGGLKDHAGSHDIARHATLNAINRLKNLGSGAIVPLDARNFREVFETNRDAAVALALADVADMINVDGRLYRRCLNEPMLGVSPPRRKTDVANIFITDEFPVKYWQEEIFRVDRYEDLVEYVMRNHFGVPTALHADNLVVQAPETFNLNDDEWTMASFTSQMLDKMHPWTKEADYDDVIVWLETREVLRAYDRSPSSETASELHTALVRLGELLPDEYQDDLSRVLDRWDNRIVNIAGFDCLAAYPT